MKILIQLKNDNIVKQIKLNKKTYEIGRGTENDIVFDVEKVSREHALLVEDGDTYSIIDKNSRNHVYVNGEQVKKKKLVSKDVINISKGVTLLYFSEDESRKKINGMVDRLWEAVNKNDFLRLKEVTNRVISLDSLNNILNVILQEIIKLVGAERGFIVLTDKKGEIRKDSSSVSYNIELNNIPFSKSVFSYSTVKKVIEERKSIFILNVETSKEIIPKSVLELDLRSIMCSPLLFGERLLGVLYVDASYKLTDFNDIDNLFFTILADHAAIAIENAKRYDQLQDFNKRLEEKIQDSEKRYQNLIEFSPEPIAVHSEGKMVFANPAALRMFGAKKPEDLIGKTVLELLHPDYHGIVKKRIQIQKDKGETVSLIEEVFIRLDGKPINVEVVATPLIYNGKKASLVLTRDITEKRKMEEEILKSQKLESIALLAGGIAHDFNNILTAILGNISLAEMNLIANKPQKCKNILGEAAKACQHARDLTQQLLTFAKGGEPVKKLVSIEKLLKQSVEFVLRGSNVRCKFLLPKTLWAAELDKGQFEQVINNIVINAIQAMPEGGTIQVKAKNVTIDSKSKFKLKSGKYIKISIKDHGIGIPENHISKIFDPYYTTKQKGSGLGLATAYSIIKKHNGIIWVESKIGKGATFYIFIPASQKRIPSITVLKEKALTGKGCVLLMDDEISVRNVAGNMLESLGYSVEYAEDGKEAVELYKKAFKAKKPFDIVILDLTIPGGMSGKEAIKELIKIDPKITAIVSSGYSNNPIMANYKAYGFSGVVEKPYSVQDLGKVLKKIKRNKK
jgi:PAS domain S-box-containing protein